MGIDDCYLGVDVGTGSARATIVKGDGTVVASSTKDTITYRDPNDHRIFEQSTDNIWEGICSAIHDCLKDGKVKPEDVKGIGFDATCSLAVSDMNMNPVSVTKGKELGQLGDRNIVLWADHRAEEEANFINSTGHTVLDFVGGVMSLEMEIPKVLWLKKHMDPSLFSRCQFFDLPDFLTYRATGDSARSGCSLTCKCSHVPSKGGWQGDFFSKIGLEQFPKEEYKQIGGFDKVLTAGMPVGNGLSKKSAKEFGLLEGTPVGSGLIDAYAGWMGTVAARHKENDEVIGEIPPLEESRHRLAAVAGTSTCHIVNSPEGIFVPGVWGPYRDAVVPGWWMNEGGQSSTGQLLDFVLKSHPAYGKLKELAAEQKTNIHQVLQEMLKSLKEEAGAESQTELTKDVHFYPDLHGNRSPIADPRMRGAIVGLELDDTVHDLARKYNLAMEAIALQTRHIVDSLNERGHKVTAIYMSGSQAMNKPMMQLFADCCSMPVVLPHSYSIAVVLGSAMLGRFAAESQGKQLDGTQIGERVWKIMSEMTPPGSIVKPAAKPKEKKILEAKYKIFREMIDIQKRWRKEMADASK